MDIKKTLVRMKVADLIPYEKNPRKIPPKAVEDVCESYRQCGVIDPIEIDEDNVILSGHTRRLAALEMGISQVECLKVTGLTDEQKRKYRILANKTGEKSSWDFDLLTTELEDLDFEGYDFEFDIPELKLGDDEDDNFDVDEELAKPTMSKLGDLWLLGRHRIICGDSTGEEAYARVMDGQVANLVLTDPPYNVNVEMKAGKIANDNMGEQEFYDFLLAAYKRMYENLADDGSIYVWHADTEGVNFRTAFKEAGFYLSEVCIWVKNHFVMGRSPYQWRHEPCLFGWKKKGKHKWYSDRSQSTVWEYDKPSYSKDHPTTKPVPLMAYPIQNSTMTNGIVLDPFLGSGSTLIACCETNRICRGIELDPKFVDVEVRRYEEWCKDHDEEPEITLIRDGRHMTLEDALDEMEKQA